jgi:uncharacterized protein (DUF58 family)
VLDASFVRRLAGIALRVQRASAAAGERPGARRVPAADFIDHRPYTPGDDLRHVDWHAAARHDQVSVKLGRAQDAADVRLLLDQSPSMSALPDKQRASCELAAALGWLALVRGDRLSAAGFPSAAERWGPASGAARAPQWLAHIRRWSSDDPVAAPDGEHGLAASARALMAAAPGGGLLLILSDLWRCDDLAAALQWAPAPRWRAIVLQVLDRSEIEPPQMGPVTLVDAETGQRQELVVDEAVQAAYGEAFRGRQARLHALCAARGAQLVTIPADWPLEQQVLPFLRRRSVLAARRW